MILKLVATTMIALAFAAVITRGGSLYSDAGSLVVTFADVGRWVGGSLSHQTGH